MKYVVLCLLSVSLLLAAAYEGTTEDLGIEIEAGPFAGGSEFLDNPDGTDYIETPGQIIETFSDEDPATGYTYISPVERALTAREDEGSSVWPDYDWADDVEIYPGQVGSGQDFDYDESTGDLYAIYDTDHDGATTNDSIVVYRSQDGGVNWSFWRATYSSSAEMNNPKVRVAHDAGGQAWVCMMYSSGSGLRVRRMTPDQTASSYETVTASLVDFADMDGDVDTGAYVYATWVPDGTYDVYAARNALDGSGWVSSALLFSNTAVTSYPAVAAGAGGTVAVAFIDDRITSIPQVRIKRSTTSGSTWLGSAQVSNSAAASLADCDIAFSHGSTQTGWITLTFNYATDNFGYYYSVNSGSDWTYGDVFVGSGDDENHGSIRAKKDTGDLTVAYNVDPGDSVMFSWTLASNPNDFEVPVKINDFNATGNWPSAAGWNGANYSAILYTNWNTNYRLMYDWFGNSTGIEGSAIGLGPATIGNTPNPFSATTNISFNLTQSSPVTISIYNITGRLVTTLTDNQSFSQGLHSVMWNGQSESGARVSPGVYFCRLSADGISQTHRMLMVR